MTEDDTRVDARMIDNAIDEMTKKFESLGVNRIQALIDERLKQL